MPAARNHVNALLYLIETNSAIVPRSRHPINASDLFVALNQQASTGIPLHTLLVSCEVSFARTTHARCVGCSFRSHGRRCTLLRRLAVNRTAKQALRLLFAAGLTVGAWYVYMHLDLALLRRGLSRASLPWLGLCTLAYLGMLPIAALQWLALLPRNANQPKVTFASLVRCYSISAVVNNTTHVVLGQSAATLLIRQLGIGTEQVLSMLLVNQLCVGVAKLMVFALAALLHALPGWMQRGIVGLFVGLLVLFLAGAVVRGLPANVLSRIASRPSILGRFLGAVATLTPTQVLVGIACALAVKLSEAVAIFAVQQAFSIGASAEKVFGVLAATAAATLVPIAPANLGTYESAVYLVLHASGESAEQSIAAAVVQHALGLLTTITPGLLLLWLDRGLQRTVATSARFAQEVRKRLRFHKGSAMD